MSRTDVALALTLLVATTVYLAALPRGTTGLDEATYLNEALRVYRGEVMYRDVFDLTTPGWVYLLAALFHVFGATFGTARITAAVIQAATAATVFATCRQIDVRREIAATAAIVCVVSAHANYPIASQHWLATLLSTLVLLVYLRSGHTRRGVFIVGLVIGALIAVHQQRGMGMGVGVGLFFIADALLDGRRRDALGALVLRALVLAAGVLVVDVPLGLLLLSQAGFRPVWAGLIQFPLNDYRRAAHCAWGFAPHSLDLAGQTFKYLPAMLLLSVARASADIWSQRATARDVIIVALHCAASILSIWYYPDHIHIAFIIPSFAVLISEQIEWLVSALPRRMALGIGVGVALALLAPCVWWLGQHYTNGWEKYRYPYDGPFGRVDVANEETVDLYTRVDTLLRDVPSRTLYCYQTTAFTCLFANGRNPTRFELLMNRYNSQAQIAEVTHVLTLKDVPYIIALPAVVRLQDPIGAFIRRNYDPLDRGASVGRYIWKRKAVPSQSIDHGP